VGSEHLPGFLFRDQSGISLQKDFLMLLFSRLTLKFLFQQIEKLSADAAR